MGGKWNSRFKQAFAMELRYLPLTMNSVYMVNFNLESASTTFQFCNHTTPHSSTRKPFKMGFFIMIFFYQLNYVAGSTLSQFKFEFIDKSNNALSIDSTQSVIVTLSVGTTPFCEIEFNSYQCFLSIILCFSKDLQDWSSKGNTTITSMQPLQASQAELTMYLQEALDAESWDLK